MNFRVWLFIQLPGCLITVIWFTFLFIAQGYNKRLVKYFAEMRYSQNVPTWQASPKGTENYFERLILSDPMMAYDYPILKNSSDIGLSPVFW